jgi:hypothetical protein
LSSENRDKWMEAPLSSPRAVSEFLSLAVRDWQTRKPAQGPTLYQISSAVVATAKGTSNASKCR